METCRLFQFYKTFKIIAMFLKARVLKSDLYSNYDSVFTSSMTLGKSEYL